VNGWYIAGGIALWCALAVAVTWIVAGSARLRDRSRLVASAPAAPVVRRPACCSKDVEGPLHHPTICTASPCCFRCPQADPRRAALRAEIEAEVLRAAAEQFRRGAATWHEARATDLGKKWRDAYTEAADVLEFWARRGGVPPRKVPAGPTGILTVPVSVSDAELSEIRKRAKPGTVVRRAEPQEDGWVL